MSTDLGGGVRHKTFGGEGRKKTYSDEDTDVCEPRLASLENKADMLMPVDCRSSEA